MPDATPEQSAGATVDLEAAADQAIEACGGDLRATIVALIVANSMLERELADVYANTSHGYLRGRRALQREGNSS
ncbi:hypothetical protein H8A95_04715 [Bradyrhizobium sp. Pear76]|uniref:hypothetical protein n=1 Tax=Bradyrhizobium oropedii TaxID=1571201 RepID=UPI001E53DF8F|nr:hypothetical protein [Bradyrhizobium oropedii]MCC8961640.1 hypothetical protein [Bradyrhizobium oropedii]